MTKTLIGRSSELERIRTLIRGVGEGQGGALLLNGAAGAGKSALLRHACELAASEAVAIVTMTGSEIGRAPFAGVRRLAAALARSGDGRMNPDTARAAGAARSPSDIDSDVAARPSSLHEVNAKLLDLLLESATVHPLVVVIDQVDDLDMESVGALTYVAQRASEFPIGLLMAQSSESAGPGIPNLPRLSVEGLAADAAVDLLRAWSGRAVDDNIGSQIAVATGGNPAAILDLAEELNGYHLRGQHPLPDPLPAGRTLERRYASRIADLSPASRLWLLIAAADGSRSTARTFAAATHLGLPADASREGEEQGIVRIGSGISFHSDLVASCVYYSATVSDRHRVHEALSLAAHEADADAEVARHLAARMLVADEPAAQALEAMAYRASVARGQDPISLMLRAANLSPAASERTRRILQAADLALGSGQHARALAITELVDTDQPTHPAGARSHATVTLIRARARVHLSGIHPIAEVTSLFDEAVQLLRAAPQEDGARVQDGLVHWALVVLEMYSEASPEIAGHLLAALATEYELTNDESPGTSRAHDAVDQILIAVHGLLSRGPIGAAERLRSALEACMADQEGIVGSTPTAKLAQICAAIFRNYEGELAFLKGSIARIPRHTRPTEAQELWERVSAVNARIGLVPEATQSLYEARAIGLTAATGDFVRAADSAHDLLAPSRAEGVLRLERPSSFRDGVPLHAALHAASSERPGPLRDVAALGWTRPSTQVLDRLSEAEQDAASAGSSHGLGVALRSKLLLMLSAGRWDDAHRLGSRLTRHGDLQTSWTSLQDVVEASARSGHREHAAQALANLEQLGEIVHSDPLAGAVARSRALLLDDPESEFLASVAHLYGPAHAVEQARSRLLYGEWLRRQRRSGDALRELTQARDVFERYQCTGFSDRATRSIDAARSVTSRSADLLTVQEQEVAKRAATGQTNVEIARALFLSRHTVDYHLRKVYQKLGVASRRELSMTRSAWTEHPEASA